MPELVDLLTQMLEFNPKIRPSARFLLKNKIFDSVRIKENEQKASCKIKILVDQPSDAIDYDAKMVDQIPQKMKFLSYIVEESFKIK